MSHRWSCALAISLSLLSTIVAQDKPAAPKSPPVSANLFEVRFADGSSLKMVLLVESLDVSTRFGKLSVPVGDLRRIDFGLRYPAGVRERIEAAIVELGHSEFKKRESAQAELLKAGELAYPLVARAGRTGNAEANKRIKAILEEMRNHLPEEKLAHKPYDSLQTSDFPITGTLAFTELKARSPVFGETTLKLTEVRSLRSLSIAGETELMLDAAKYGLPQDHWLETELELGDTNLEIRADGKVDLYPLGGERGMYMATPDGIRPGGRPTTFPSGALLGKIGPNGKPFAIGSKFQGAPAGDGKLYLKMEASPWGVVPSGSYAVKITAGK